MGACDSKNKSVSSSSKASFKGSQNYHALHSAAADLIIRKPKKSLRVSFMFIIGDILMEEEEAAEDHEEKKYLMAPRSRSPVFCKKKETPKTSQQQQRNQGTFSPKIGGGGIIVYAHH
jgi:ribonuclease I